MTMPEKIYVGEGAGFEGDDILIADVMDWCEATASYIRADIVEELVGDLEYARERLALGGFIIGQCDSLARYHAATEGK